MPGEFDINRMQEEAIRRAREMQSRARAPSRQGRSQQPPNREPQEPSQPKPAPAEPPQPSQPPAEAEAPSHGGLLDSLFQDKERTVILALLILLSGEEGSHELMFALMFLLM